MENNFRSYCIICISFWVYSTNMFLHSFFCRQNAVIGTAVCFLFWEESFTRKNIAFSVWHHPSASFKLLLYTAFFSYQICHLHNFNRDCLSNSWSTKYTALCIAGFCTIVFLLNLACIFWSGCTLNFSMIHKIHYTSL